MDLYGSIWSAWIRMGAMALYGRDLVETETRINGSLGSIDDLIGKIGENPRKTRGLGWGGLGCHF